MNPAILILHGPTMRKPWWGGCYKYTHESGRFILTYEWIAIERDFLIELLCRVIPEPRHL